MHLRNRASIITLSGVFAFGFVVGCEKSQDAPQPAPQDELQPVPSASATGSDAAETGDSGEAGVEAILAKADAYDGTTDKVVSMCAACNLGMDGSQEHALATHGYTIHFCSPGCKGKFETDTDKAVLAMKIPDA